MSPGRAIMFSVSTISLAVGVAWSAPQGPESPRARFAGWLRQHGHSTMAQAIEPPTAFRTDGLPGAPKDSPLPPQVIPTLP